jgi:hypothetical protein
MKALKTLALWLLILATLSTSLFSCRPEAPSADLSAILEIEGSGRLSMTVGDTMQLNIDQPDEILALLTWSATNDCVSVNEHGVVTAMRTGTVIVAATVGELRAKVLIEVVDAVSRPTSVVLSAEKTALMVGESIDLSCAVTPDDTALPVSYRIISGADAVSLENGRLTALAVGSATLTATVAGVESAPLTITVTEAVDPYIGVSADEFYADYAPADSYIDAYYRTQHGFMSGSLTVPDQAPVLSEYQPEKDGMLIRNNVTRYVDDGNTYIVVDAFGNEVMEIYRGAAYITLEEVAAYVYAFGDVPANYSTSKKTKPTKSIWGIYLRVNHTAFSGDTSRYPYEPELPDISGCGGELYYFEIDIGTTGNDCDPSYRPAIYNNGTSITRGASRIVYTRFDKNNDQIIDPNEKYLFYTYNHYNDFQEYLNYYGGWGEMFGNITGGGTISSKTHYNPTPYVPVYMGPLNESTLHAPVYHSDGYVEFVWCIPFAWSERKYA